MIAEQQTSDVGPQTSGVRPRTSAASHCCEICNGPFTLVILSRRFWRRRISTLLAVPMLSKKTAQPFAPRSAAQDDKRIRAGDLEAVFHNRTISHTDPMKSSGEE